MSKEEFLKIQTCVLKVNIHCDGCKHKVKKILHKIDGVYKTNIDSELGKVTVSGNVDPETLIKKLAKSGKHAEIWGASKANNNQQNQLNNQFKNLQIDSGKGGNNKGQGGGGQKGGGGGNNQQQPKGGGGGGPIGGQGLNPMQLQQLKALQDKMPQLNPMQLQQLKALQDKMPQLKDLKMPPPMPFGNNNKKDQNNQKSVKFMPPPEDEDLTDDEFDDEDYDDEEFDDDEIEDEMDDIPPLNNKMKPAMVPQAMLPNMLMNNGGNNGGANGKKGGPGGGGGGGGNIPVQINLGGGGGNNNGGGKKGGNGNNNQNQGGGGGGGAGQKGGKNGGGLQNGGGGGGGGGQNKNGNNGHGGGGGGGGGGGVNPNFNANGAKKVGGMNDGLHGMPNMMAMNAAGGGNVGPSLGSMPMGQMGHMGNVPMGQMGQMPNVAAVQGLPAPAINGANAGGYFQGAGPEMMAGNPYYQQQQMAAMMMNQQRANGNERFQPMMYARPPPAVNYWPPHPYSSYPYHAPPPGEHYTDAFNDENTSSCSVM